MECIYKWLAIYEPEGAEHLFLLGVYFHNDKSVTTYVMVQDGSVRVILIHYVKSITQSSQNRFINSL